MMRPSTSSHFPTPVRSPSKSVRFQLDNDTNAPFTASSQTTHIRSILKHRHFANFLEIANDKMLRELEQCVEERDRIVASIAASPVDVSRLSPRTLHAQMQYRDHMAEERDRMSAVIEDKFNLLKETLKEADMPSWMSGKENAIDLTLIGHKKPKHLKLFRRQSSLFFFQSCIGKDGASGLHEFSAHSGASNINRLRRMFLRCDSADLERDCSAALLIRISQRLAAH